MAEAASVTITLDRPIKRGESQLIESIMVREPGPGELRGLDIQDLMTGDINALLAVVPRVTVPPLITEEVERMKLSDLVQVTGALRGFMMSEEEQAAVGKFLGQYEGRDKSIA